MTREPNDPSEALIAEFIRGFTLANALYYHGTGSPEDQSPWCDHVYDQRVRFLERWRHLWPADFATAVGTADLKTAAHSLRTTDADLAAARQWVASGNHWPST